MAASLPGPRTTAAVGVVLSAATGVVINLVTTRWDPAMAAAAVVLVAAGAATAAAPVTRARAGDRTGMRITARRHGTVDGARIAAGPEADARVGASGAGARVSNLDVDVHDAEAIAKATGRGQISNSSMTQKKS